MEEAPKTKRVTKKALEEFCTANGITEDRIHNLLESAFPATYKWDEATYKAILHHLFKNYEFLTDEDIISSINGMQKNLYKYSFDYAHQAKMSMRLEAFLDKVVEIAEVQDIKASQIEGWDEEMREYIKRKVATWSVFDEVSKEIQWGKVFNNMLSYYRYERQNPPFHCYNISRDEVLFTKVKLYWNGNSYQKEPIQDAPGTAPGTAQSNSGCCFLLGSIAIAGITTTLLLFF